MVNPPVRLNLLSIHPGLVDRTFSLDPKREQLINSSDLENGMTVLIAADINRYSVRDLVAGDIALVPDILITNRWCTVRKLRRIGGRIHFVGEYQDGSTHPRIYKIQNQWVAKIRSVELFESLANDIASNKAKKALEEKREKILKLVTDVSEEQRSIMVLYGTSDPEDMNEVIKKTVDAIMGVFEQ